MRRGAPLAPATGEHAASLEELARWFGNAERTLAAVARETPAAPQPRCWPHHFDMATLITLETGPDGSALRSVGVGLSPGDHFYAEPYWYVSPWPHPERSPARLPELPAGGHWHGEGFTAAILTGTQLLAGGTDASQGERLQRFLDAAIAHSHALAIG